MIENKKIRFSSVAVHLIFILACLLCLVPLLIVISASFSSESDLYKYGYGILPKTIDLTAYLYIFANPNQILQSYYITTLVTIVGTFLSVIIMAMVAYPLSRTSFILRNQVMFYIFFTMLFSGGMVPSYILISQYLKMSDTIWVLIIPSLINVFHIILIRTFFQKLPVSLIESTKLDGASEFRILFQIIIPLSKPVLATVAFLGAMARWNDWFTALLYIRNEDLVTLQYLLHRIMTNITFISMNMDKIPAGMQSSVKIPGETARMAMMVLAAGPMLFVFPFFQKYFISGLTVGAVKG